MNIIGPSDILDQYLPFRPIDSLASPGTSIITIIQNGLLKYLMLLSKADTFLKWTSPASHTLALPVLVEWARWVLRIPSPSRTDSYDICD